MVKNDMDYNFERFCRNKITLLLIIMLVLVLSGCSSNSQGNSGDDSDIKEYMGDYEFYEFYPPNINMLYFVSVYKENDKYQANITIDGFQTNMQLLADIEVNSEGIDFIFSKYISESTGEVIEIGDILLSFKKNGNEIHTYWGVIQPILPENSEVGKTYFVKVEE